MIQDNSRTEIYDGLISSPGRAAWGRAPRERERSFQRAPHGAYLQPTKLYRNYAPPPLAQKGARRKWTIPTPAHPVVLCIVRIVCTPCTLAWVRILSQEEVGGPCTRETQGSHAIGANSIPIFP